jgi:hypothetical protein
LRLISETNVTFGLNEIRPDRSKCNIFSSKKKNSAENRTLGQLLAGQKLVQIRHKRKRKSADRIQTETKLKDQTGRDFDFRHRGQDRTGQDSDVLTGSLILTGPEASS